MTITYLVHSDENSLQKMSFFPYFVVPKFEYRYK